MEVLANLIPFCSSLNYPHLKGLTEEMEKKLCTLHTAYVRSMFQRFLWCKRRNFPWQQKGTARSNTMTVEGKKKEKKQSSQLNIKGNKKLIMTIEPLRLEKTSKMIKSNL